MKHNEYPGFRLDSFNLVTFLFRNWKTLLVTAVAAFIISVAISYTIKPLYRSSVVLYPSSEISSPGTDLFTPGSGNPTFGDEEGTEKILQILQSDNIRNWLIEKYDLFNHYNIDPGAKYRYSDLAARMDKNINFRKTQFMSVRLSVLDTDPQIAADMANDIARLIDSTFNRLLMDVSSKRRAALLNQLMNQEKLVVSIEDSLSILMEKRIPGISVTAGNLRDTRTLRYATNSPEFIRLSALHESALEDLASIRQKLTEADMASLEEFPYTILVNKARVAEKKAIPDRLLIAVASTLSAILLAFFVLLFAEGLRFSDNKWGND